ncbi:hypothetical protein B0J14DRAFT_568341 [Halenospora varia]|nr:hypothetical protein B0J14DRAFT_568341 [Halenospora varia]
MRLSKSSKAVFFIINHVSAVYLPHDTVQASRVQGSKPAAVRQKNDASIITNNLLPRLGQDTGGDGASCPRCKSRCKGNKIINPFDCTICIPCFPGLKADPTSTICLPKSADDDEKKKKEEEEEKRKQEEEDKKKQEIEDQKKKDEEEKRKQQKQEKYEKKMEEKKGKYEQHELRKKDNKERNKARRMSRCLTFVSLAMGATAAAMYADEFFSEDYLESLDVLELWPPELPIEDWEVADSDAIFDTEPFIDAWVLYANSISVVGKRGNETEVVNRKEIISGEISPLMTDRSSVEDVVTPVLSGSTALVEYVEPRYAAPIAGIVAIFTVLIVAIVKVATRAGKAGGNILKASNYKIKLASRDKVGRKSKTEQQNGAKEIAKNKNWRNCLLKTNPVK